MRRSVWLWVSLLCTWPAALAGQHSAGVPQASDIVAIVGDTAIQATELDEAVGSRATAMHAQLYRVKRAALESLIADALLAQEARRRKISVADLTREEIDDKVTPVGEEEVKAVYAAAREHLGNTEGASAQESIRASLQQSRIQTRRMIFVAQLRRKAGVRVLLEPPRVAVSAGTKPARGAPDAPVAIIVFSDYACPFCARLSATMKQVQQTYGGSQVKIVYRDFPLAIHPQAKKAAEAATCARDQNKFWEMHDRLFAEQQHLQVTDLKRYATEIGLDVTKFNRCLDTGERAPDVELDQQEGERYGVAGTPATFINGRLIPGAMAVDEYLSAIEDELQRTQKYGSTSEPKDN